MRLKQIKLAGFKSFVDPTTVRFPGSRSAVVGPNGCGKSNVIDAVRWVMGESSAKQLRGESITDVIFSGSSARKPTSMATVELLFDNSDARIGGEYASYAEIAIRRQVTRDAQSSYFINGKKCRRRDILDVFLGTGFGPRSYSIIEQGMISQLIEAKPEELRVYLEEAAGISKYKERRRETENRIKHTVENLDRLNDIREELEKQLAKLNRQASAAAKYRELKEEERELTAQLYTLRLIGVDGDLEDREKAITELENQRAEKLAQIQGEETKIEKSRLEYTERSEAMNSVQSQFYKFGSDINRIEEAVKYNQQRVAQLELDLDTVSTRDGEARRQLEMDDTRINEYEETLATLSPQLDEARDGDESQRSALGEVETEVQAWQSGWDEFSSQSAQAEQAAQVQAARIDHVENLLQRLRGRMQQLQMEAAADTESEVTSDVASLTEQIEQTEAQQQAIQGEVAEALEALSAGREALSQAERSLEDSRTVVNDLRHELTSTEALQKAALGEHNTDVQTWLAEQSLQGGARLGEQLSVVPGWELAVEAVLGGDLQAIRVDQIDGYADALARLPSGSVTLFEGRTQATTDGALPLLATLVRGDELGLGALIDGVYAAESVSVALAQRESLANFESIVTRDGLWFGRDWVRAIRGEENETGIIQRAQQIETLSIALEEAEQRLADLQDSVAETKISIQDSETTRDALQQRSGELDRELGQLRADLGVKQVRIEEAESRRERLIKERTDIEAQVATESLVLTEARGRLGEAETIREAQTERRLVMLEERDSNSVRLEEARSAARAAQDRFHQINSELQNATSHLSAARTARDRLVAQTEELVERRKAITDGIESSQQPLPELQEQLEGLLAERLTSESSLSELRGALEQVDRDIRSQEEHRGTFESALEALRGKLEQARVDRQGLTVKAETLREQLGTTGLEFDAVKETLPEEASDKAWTEALDKMERRINRLGPINLAAIDEFESQSERKTYLDAQFADLEEALATLQNAIRKIDKETRIRFKETFEEVDKRLGVLFPKVFGGGHASLELTGEDLLDTGVSLMARPPGKRNASVHLLSGGEKALTAIALIFAIFQLNPSPVCLLDEVDAPLDDSNVVRFADLIKEMSAEVQFVVITHNKLTMEMADHLMGVTQHEAGVSRLVSVDVEEAAELAAV